MVSYDVMKTELKSRLGNRQDLDTRMDRWINYAFFEIVSNPRFNFWELDSDYQFTTVAATAEYDIQSGAGDLHFILDVRDTTNERKLLRTHWSYLDKVVATSGAPTRYYRFGPNIILEPTPDDAYDITVRYRKRPNDLSTNNSSFEGLGTEWEEKIITLAAIKAFEALKLPQEAAGQRQLYEAMLSTMNDVLGLEDYDSETGVQVSLMPRL